ncbi:MAG TPA: SPOR domain-containing protein [Mesorhizobium sp.]
MADKTSGGVPGRSDLDPFAELTRIMGFDPRVPVAQQESGPEAVPDEASAAAEPAQPAEAAAATDQGSDDFSIDLEKELFGEFSDQSGSDVEAAPATAQSDDVSGDVDFEGIEDDISEHVDAFLSDDAVAPVSHHRPAETEAAPVQASEEADTLDDLDLDEGNWDLASEPSDEPRSTGETPYQEVAMADVDLDFDELADAAWSADQPQDPAAAARLEAEYNALLGNQSPAEEPASGAHTAAKPDAAAERAASIIAGTWRRRAPTDEGRDFAIPQSSPFAHLTPKDFDDGWVEEPQAELEPEAVVETQGQAAAQAGADTLDDDLVNALSEAEPEELDLPQVAETAEPRPASTPEDPFAALAAMAARYQTGAQDSWRETTRGYETARQEPPMEAPVRSSAPAAPGWPAAPAAHRPAAPEIETVDVYDDAVALADDLNIPDLNYDEPAVDPYDDLDAEFNHLLKEMSSGDKREPTLRPTSAYTPASPPRQMAYQQPAQPAAPRAQHPAYVEQRDYQPRSAHAPQTPAQAAQDDQDFDLSGDAYFEDAMASFEADGRDDDYADFDAGVAAPASRKPRRGLMIAAIVGGLAIIGGIGAVALSFGGISQPGELTVIKADGKPIKVRPENPGGATVPNQDSTVYDTVSRSASNEAPVQERLVSSAEEPIDLPVPNDEEMVGDEAFDDQAKDEDRLAPQVAENTADSEDMIAVAPRKVRTMVVKSDGSLVPREEPSQEVTNSTSEAKPTAKQDAAADDEAATEQITTGATQQAEPAAAPQAPAAAEAEVAALEPAAPPAPGSWSVQVSSQPSETGANKSLKDISRKYASVIGDRGAHIVKADVAGKGTFWRVRIPAGSREDAVGLCGDLKAAGGSCFVTK